MNFRLYESAWVVVEGSDAAMQAHRDPLRPGAFRVGEFSYDIDARALSPEAPKLLSILSLQAAREAGLRSNYGSGSDGSPPQASAKRR
ncbi:hypothetical protein ABAC402_03115 [Asticcacaulis sp. AC402]|nr:hypothetical protein ABAC402_03115 [Asticcacaulis sp. AC402]